jgi:hypothetical protein
MNTKDLSPQILSRLLISTTPLNNKDQNQALIHSRKIKAPDSTSVLLDMNREKRNFKVKRNVGLLKNWNSELLPSILIYWPIYSLEGM